MIYKNLVCASISFGLAISVTHAMPIKVNIDNQVTKNGTAVSLSNAQIRVSDGNDWIDIGSLKPGKNNFNINSVKNNKLGVFRSSLNGSEYIVGSFKENPNSTGVNISLKNKVIAPVFSALQRSNMETKTNNVLSISSNNQISMLTTFHGNLKGTNSWAATCNGTTAGGGYIGCYISSTPSMSFNIPNGGWGYFVSGGTFSSTYSPKELVNMGNNINVGGGGFLYMHMDMWNKKTGDKVAWYNGGGAVAGGFGGLGQFFYS